MQLADKEILKSCKSSSAASTPWPCTAAERWNPLKTGRTFFLIKPFYQRRTMDVDDNNIDFFPPQSGIMTGDEIDFASNGIEIALEYDNRDFSPNPAKGSYTRIGLTSLRRETIFLPLSEVIEYRWQRQILQEFSSIAASVIPLNPT
jgi:hypothetical protein